MVVYDSLGGVSRPAYGTIQVAAVNARFFIAPPPQGLPGTPTFGNISFDGIGNLLISENFYGSICGFGFCGSRVLSVTPDGAQRWDAPLNSATFLSGDSIALNVVSGSTFDNHAYFLGGRNTLFALDVDGLLVAGWPQTIPPTTGFDSTFFTGLAIDGSDGTVFVKVGVRQSFTGFPTTIATFKPDGSAKWPTLTYGTGGGGGGMTQGPGGQLYTVIGTDCAGCGSSLVGIDHQTGALFCSVSNLFVGSLVGNPAGVFGVSLPNTTTVFDQNCVGTNVFSTDRYQLQLWGIVEGTLIGTDSFISPFGGDPTTARLLGVFQDGTFLWRNAQILPISTTTPVRATVGLNIYVLGQDLVDGNQKFFLVQSRSGEIVESADLAPLCGDVTNCDVAAGPDGAIYVLDKGNANITKIQ